MIDTGIDYTHPDLAANIWTNTAEIQGNGKDDDGNGFVDDVHGYDFANNDGDPMDDNGHGTHVAGTIGAVGNNGIGVAGIDWNVKLMALKFLDATGSGLISNAIRALDYAVMMGAQVSNNSYGGGGYDPAFADAIHNAQSNGHILVAAAGNDGLNNDTTPSYPSNYNFDNVVSVAATDHNDQLASFSNYGASTVDLAAPGVDILSTYKGGGYAYMSGTSMATPHVTGAVALIRDQHPDWSYTQVIQQLLSTTDPLSSLQGKTITGGRLDLGRALALPTDSQGARILSSSLAGSVSGPVNHVRLTFSEPIDPSSFLANDIRLTGPGGVIPVSSVSVVAGSNNTQFDATFASQSTAGSYQAVVGPDIRDASGNPMDQNRDGRNGDTPADQFTTSFSIQSPSIASDGVYDARVAPYQPIDLVPGAPGVITLMNGGDDSVVYVNMGSLTFNFYGSSYSTLYLSSNGLISFGGNTSSAQNTDLSWNPTARTISPLWDDWISTNGNAMILAKVDDTNGDGAADRLILEWNKVQGYASSPSTVTFQAILQLNTGSTPGEITFNYPDIDSGDYRSNGGSATVGLKDGSSYYGTRRLLVSYNNAASPYVRSGQAIRFTPKAATVSGSRVSGGVLASASADAPTTNAPTLPVLAGAIVDDVLNSIPVQTPKATAPFGSLAGAVRGHVNQVVTPWSRELLDSLLIGQTRPKQEVGFSFGQHRRWS